MRVRGSISLEEESLLEVGHPGAFVPPSLDESEATTSGDVWLAERALRGKDPSLRYRADCTTTGTSCWRRRLQNKAEFTERDRRRRKDAGEGIPEPPKLRTAAALSVAAWWTVQLIMLISVTIPAAIPRPQLP